MSFDRNERARSVLTSLVASFIREESNSNPLITVTSIETSADFHEATIFVTVYPSDKEEASLIFLKRKGSDMRSYITKHSRLRSIPFFHYAIDGGEQNRQHIDEVVKRIEGEEEK